MEKRNWLRHFFTGRPSASSKPATAMHRTDANAHYWVLSAISRISCLISIWISFLVFGGSLLLPLVAFSAEEHELKVASPLILGIHPYESASRLLSRFKPLADYLTQQIGRPVGVEIAKDYRTHIESIGDDRLDIAYMGPASYIELTARMGAKPLLARQAIDGSPTFHGVIFTRRDSGLTTLEELAGKRFAFGDPQSTMSHLVPRYMLMKAGVAVDRLSGYNFLGSHDDVALAVLAGDYDAGAVKEEVFTRYRARGLRMLAMTPAFSEHLLVGSNKLSVDLVYRLRNALFALGEDPQGQKIMQGIKSGMTGWVPVEDSNYEGLRTILGELKKSGIQP